MREGWERTTLDDACEITYGTRVIKKRDAGSAYPVYGGGGETFRIDRFNREDCTIISRFGMSESCVRHVTGKFFLNDSGLSVAPKSANNLYPRFLDHFLYASQRDIYSLGRGSAQKNLDVTNFRKLELSYPKSLHEQRRIVAMLDEAFAGIATAVANTERNVANARELFESYLNSVFSQRGEGWTKYLLSDVCEFENGDRGRNYPNKSVLVEHGVPFVNAGHLTDGKVSLSTMSYIPEERFHLLSNGKFSAGDILFCLRGSLGKFGVVGPEVGEGAIASSLVIVRPRTECGIGALRRDFLVHYFRSDLCSEMIKRYAGGAAQPNLGARDLAKFEIFLPSLEQQEGQVTRLNGLLDDTRRLEQIIIRKLSALAELKQSLLQKAFSGELTATPQDEIETAVA